MTLLARMREALNGPTTPPPSPAAAPVDPALVALLHQRQAELAARPVPLSDEEGAALVTAHRQLTDEIDQLEAAIDDAEQTHAAALETVREPAGLLDTIAAHEAAQRERRARLDVARKQRLMLAERAFPLRSRALEVQQAALTADVRRHEAAIAEASTRIASLEREIAERRAEIARHQQALDRPLAQIEALAPRERVVVVTLADVDEWRAPDEIGVRPLAWHEAVRTAREAGWWRVRLQIDVDGAVLDLQEA